MKKLLCIALALMLTMSIFAGCGKTEKTDAPEQNVTEDSGKQSETKTDAPEGKSSDAPEGKKDDGTPAPELTQPAPSTNKEVVTEEEAPDVYLVMGGDDNAASISYHLEGCKLLEGGESQKIAWEMVKTLGFRQCPECNPPQYEEYVE